jgi:hypothetical protein
MFGHGAKKGTNTVHKASVKFLFPDSARFGMERAERAFYQNL